LEGLFKSKKSFGRAEFLIKQLKREASFLLKKN